MSLCLLVDLVSDFQIHRANSQSTEPNDANRVSSVYHYWSHLGFFFQSGNICICNHGHRGAVEFHHSLTEVSKVIAGLFTAVETEYSHPYFKTDDDGLN